MPRPSRKRMPDPVSWETDDSVREIAGELITAYHGHLEGQPIAYLLRSRAALAKGGKTKKTRILQLGGLNAQLSGAKLGFPGQSRIYIVEISKYHWQRMGEDEQRAELDLALSKLIAGKDALQIIDLGVRDYAPIINRHGIFCDDLTTVAKAVLARQHELDFGAEAAKGPESSGDRAAQSGDTADEPEAELAAAAA